MQTMQAMQTVGLFTRIASKECQRNHEREMCKKKIEGRCLVGKEVTFKHSPQPFAATFAQRMSLSKATWMKSRHKEEQE